MKAKEMAGLYWFCQSVEFGGFAAASLNTRVSAPTLSRAVSQLEEQIGEKLVHRNAKQFQLTVAGAEYYQRFAPVFREMNVQWEQLSNRQPSLTGDIRVSCPEPFADRFLQPAAIEFMAQHPGVSVHIEFASDTDGFFDDQIDLAITTKPTSAPHLVQRQLFNLKLSLAAAPVYLEQHGRPFVIEDLLEHNLLAGNMVPYWELKQKGKAVRVPLRPKYSVDSLRLVIQAACSGVGICLVPDESLEPLLRLGKLEQVMPDVECPAGVAFIVWTDRRLVSTRVTAFRDMVLQKMGQPLAFLAEIAQPPV